MANTAIGTDGDFTVTQLATGVNNEVAFINNTGAGISGVVAVRAGSATFASATARGTPFTLDLEPGETWVVRNAVANTHYTYTGSVKHTAVKQGVATEYNTKQAEGHAAISGGVLGALVLVSVLS